MKHKSKLLLAACAVPALWAFSTPGDRVAFTIGSGDSLTKSFISESEMGLEDMTVVMNGEEMDMGMLGAFEMNVSASQTVQVTDEYLAVSEGRPSKLRRTYDSLANEISMEASGNPMMPGGSDMAASSELEGKSVDFEWDADADDYVASFAEGEEGDDELLADLFGDMDLRAFLPSGEVSKGDTWDVDPAHLIHLLAPGGNLKVVPDEVSEMTMSMPGSGMNPFETFGEFDGTINAEYLGSREVDGTRVAAVKLTIEASTAKDMTDLVSEMMDEMEMPEEMGEMEMNYDSVDIEFEFSGSGELLWDLAGGHIHALDVSGDMIMAMDMAYAMAMGAMEMDMEISMEMAGSQTLSVVVGTQQ